VRLRPGRPRPAEAELIRARAVEFVRLRGAGLTLAEIGRRYGVSRQRVGQVIDGTARVPRGEVREARRETQRARARARSGEVIERFRAGLAPLEIARQTGVPVRAVRALISERASEADRQARALTYARPPRPPSFSDEQLISGLRRVAERLGHAPSQSEYADLAGELSLASMQTVYFRFGGWRRALTAAGLESSAPARVYAPQWHLAACWRAVQSVADQLGDPPRYRRYLELAAERDDLPSGATLRVRLGLWSQIAAALQAQNGTGAKDQQRVEARL
jgi:DNA-binding CsgD family transcriptional regulator